MDTDTYAPAVPGGRPVMERHAAALVDEWLVPNGIVGWLPDGSTITVRDGRITWPRWRHVQSGSGPWDPDLMLGWDIHQPDEPGYGDWPVVDEVTVPLRVPVTDRVRELFRRSTLRLVER